MSTGSGDRWRRGDVVARREVLGLDPIPRDAPLPHWHGQAWAIGASVVVEDAEDALVTYFPPEGEFVYPPGDWPIAGGAHPWDTGTRRWQGHGCLMIQRPGDHMAVWHFWTGPEREFVGWYVNLQTAFVRTPVGYDTQDLELDLVVDRDGRVTVKDDELLDVRVEEGRLTRPLASWIRDLGADLRSRIERGDWWWSRDWADWTPDPDWHGTDLPEGWAERI